MEILIEKSNYNHYVSVQDHQFWIKQMDGQISPIEEESEFDIKQGWSPFKFNVVLNNNKYIWFGFDNSEDAKELKQRITEAYLDYHNYIEEL